MNQHKPVLQPYTLNTNDTPTVLKEYGKNTTQFMTPVHNLNNEISLKPSKIGNYTEIEVAQQTAKLRTSEGVNQNNIVITNDMNHYYDKNNHEIQEAETQENMFEACNEIVTEMNKTETDNNTNQYDKAFIESFDFSRCPADDTQNQQLIKLLCKNRDIFQLKNDPDGCTHLIRQEIKIKEGMQLPYSRPKPYKNSPV